MIKTEEKGSDVNLATYLLVDAFRGDAEAFAVVSNDSDLTEPIRIVRHELGKVVGLLNPQPVPSQRLLTCRPTFARQIRPGVLGRQSVPAAAGGRLGVGDPEAGRLVKKQKPHRSGASHPATEATGGMITG